MMMNRLAMKRLQTASPSRLMGLLNVKNQCQRSVSSSIPLLLGNRPTMVPLNFYDQNAKWSSATTRPTIDNTAAVANTTVTTRFKSTMAASATYDLSVQEFPSLVIGPDRTILPQGTFAEAQAQYLDPDPESVASLRDGLLKTNMGIVAHYYMDVELQGVLQAVKNSHPDLENRVGIADSLKMGDLAVDMCRGVTTSVACLGVDFMSESVAAILAKNQMGHVPVYRATSQAIGCSLAESAERDSYRAWLQKESSNTDQPCLHVIYINTSLETKAVSSSLVPTITCTSSNVLQTLLQSAAQIPNIKVLYGPDTYMGHNLQTLLDVILASPDWTDEKIATDLHPKHSNATLATLRKNLVVFPEGNCVVHHMFGSEVVQTVKDKYNDCYMTAHLEVPGEMFEISMQKSLTDDGVVGSTSDILKFITRKVQEAAEGTATTTATDPSESSEKKRLKFVLGTEAGMVTSIVQSVQGILERTGNKNIEAEIIFPVASDAVMSVEDNPDMAIVPGVSGGEGCSTAGGCATCPFMKMNDLDALEEVIEMVHRTQQKEQTSSKDEAKLMSHLPPDRLRGKTIGGVDATDLGTEAIVFMREFMQHKELPKELVQKVKRL